MAIHGHSRTFAFKKRKKLLIIAVQLLIIAVKKKDISVLKKNFWLIPGQFLVIPVKTKHQSPIKVHPNSILTFTKFHLGEQ